MTITLQIRPQCEQIRYVGSQDFGRYLRVQYKFLQTGGDQPAFTLLIFSQISAPREIPTAGQNHEELKMFGIRKDFNRCDGFPAFGCEIAACCEQRFVAAMRSQTDLRCFAANGVAKLNYTKGLFNVQLSGLPARIDSPIIANTIGQVRILLNLAKHHSGPDGVRRSRSDEKGVSRLHAPVNEDTFQRVSFEGP